MATILELNGGEFTAIDFETTGSVLGWPSEPWQIGLYRFTIPSPHGDGQTVIGPKGAATAAPRTFSSLLRVSANRPFNRFAPGRHSLLRTELAAAPTLAELWEEISPWLKGSALVAHNIGTERSILRAAAPLERFGPWIDTLALSRALFPGRSSYALEDIIPDLGIAGRVAALAPGLAPHDALYDAIACGELLRRCAEGGLTQVTSA